MQRSSIIAAALILVSQLAAAEVFTWDPPEFYADGVTPFDPKDLHEYRIYCGTAERPMMVVTRGGRNRGQTDDSPAPLAFAPLPAGSFQSCYVTAASQNGLESLPSNVREFVAQSGQDAPRCWMEQSRVTGLWYQHCNLWF